jgi:chorismate-pyruvate lyase
MAEFDPASRLRQLFEIFAGKLPVQVPEFEIVPGEEVPPPYRDLLVHNEHMTVTLERFHGRPVELRVLARHVEGGEYARMILLALEGTDEIVEFGIIRLDLNCCSKKVQDEIVAGNTPLGRILIEHDVLRRIDPTAFLKIRPTDALKEWFGISESRPIYGRLASIYCDNALAIELLEVVRPEPQKV